LKGGDTMKTIDINQALPKIKELMEIASQGGEIIITKDNEYWVKLVSVKPLNKRPSLFGSDKNIISITDDFDELLEDFKEYM
jgi:prevent-host-death family protein